MNFKTREHIYVRHNGQEYVIRPETTGVEHNRVISFYDTTSTTAVGFSKDFCLGDCSLFKVVRDPSMAAKEVSLGDVWQSATEIGLSKEQCNQLIQQLKTF